MSVVALRTALLRVVRVRWAAPLREERVRARRSGSGVHAMAGVPDDGAVVPEIDGRITCAGAGGSIEPGPSQPMSRDGGCGRCMRNGWIPSRERNGLRPPWVRRWRYVGR